MAVCELNCPCGASVDYDNPMRGGYNVTQVIRATGWRPLYLRDGGTVWLCPECTSLAAAIAHRLIRVVGTDKVQLGQIGGL
ncbi:MAG: hypothetical protein ACYSUB_02015 [Planctomycetota bacterium]|jgi:hypothetical protein